MPNFNSWNARQNGTGSQCQYKLRKTNILLRNRKETQISRTVGGKSYLSGKACFFEPLQVHVFMGKVSLKHMQTYTPMEREISFILYLYFVLMLYFDFFFACHPEKRKSSGVERAADLKIEFLSFSQGSAPWKLYIFNELLSLFLHIK